MGTEEKRMLSVIILILLLILLLDECNAFLASGSDPTA